jgi:xanthine dehydrogenase large subunit
VDARAALAMPGVRGVVLAADMPGDKLLAAFAHDEPVFAVDTVQHIGQVVGLVVADTVMQARRAARAVQLDITPLPAVLTVQAALQAESYVLPPVFVRRGDAAAGLAQAPHRLQRRFEVGGQEHFLPGRPDRLRPAAGAKAVVDPLQHAAPRRSAALGGARAGHRQPRRAVECRRMGGGFGGKETQAGHLAVWAAVAAHKLGRPVKLRLDRDDDFMVTGKRHPFAYDYDVGFDDTGRITGLQLHHGCQLRLQRRPVGPVADRAVFHADNAYYLSDVEIASYRCKTNTQSHTAFRGFGGPQGVIVIEAILGDIARTLGLDPLDVRLANLYGGRQRGPQRHPLPDDGGGQHPARAAAPTGADIALPPAPGRDCRLERASPVLKRGMAITPVKFGISFTATLFNQAGALVHVYTDGSVQVNHGGTEMGQGLHTKVAQIVADELGVPLHRVLVTASDTSKVPNASATAASSGTDLNGRAAQYAARTCARQPGRVRLRAGRLRRRRHPLCGRAGHLAQDRAQL